jgi:hypothetical protein
VRCLAARRLARAGPRAWRGALPWSHLWDRTTDLRPHCRFGLDQRVPPITKVNLATMSGEIKLASSNGTLCPTSARSPDCSRTAALCSLECALRHAQSSARQNFFLVDPRLDRDQLGVIAIERSLSVHIARQACFQYASQQATTLPRGSQHWWAASTAILTDGEVEMPVSPCHASHNFG